MASRLAELYVDLVANNRIAPAIQDTQERILRLRKEVSKPFLFQKMQSLVIGRQEETALRAKLNRMFDVAQFGKFGVMVRDMGEAFNDLAGRIGFVGGMFPALVGGMSGFVAAASPDTFRTFTMSLQYLGASVGQILLPVFIDLIRLIQDAARWVQNLSPETKELIRTVAMWALGITGVAFAVSKLIAILGTLTTVLRAIGLMNPFGILLGGLGVLITRGVLSGGLSGGLAGITERGFSGVWPLISRRDRGLPDISDIPRLWGTLVHGDERSLGTVRSTSPGRRLLDAFHRETGPGGTLRGGRPDSLLRRAEETITGSPEGGGGLPSFLARGVALTGESMVRSGAPAPPSRAPGAPAEPAGGGGGLSRFFSDIGGAIRSGVRSAAAGAATAGAGMEAAGMRPPSESRTGLLTGTNFQSQFLGIEQQWQRIQQSAASESPLEAEMRRIAGESLATLYDIRDSSRATAGRPPAPPAVGPA